MKNKISGQKLVSVKLFADEITIDLEYVCSVVSDSSETPWTVVHQPPLSMGFLRQEYWSGLPFPPPGDLPDPGLNSCFLHWQVDSLPLSHWGNPNTTFRIT